MKKRIAKYIERTTIRNLNKEITKYVAGKRVLDYGCGKGSFVYSKHRDKEIWGVDIKQNSEYPGKFKLVSGSQIPFEDNYFDCIVFAGVIQYIENYDKAMSEIKRVLKKEGLLIIATVNRNSLFRRLRIINPSPKRDAGEYNIFSFMEIEDILNKHGFKPKKSIGVDFVLLPKSVCSNSLFIAKN